MKIKYNVRILKDSKISTPSHLKKYNVTKMTKHLRVLLVGHLLPRRELFVIVLFIVITV